LPGFFINYLIVLNDDRVGLNHCPFIGSAFFIELSVNLY